MRSGSRGGQAHRDVRDLKRRAAEAADGGAARDLVTSQYPRDGFAHKFAPAQKSNLLHINSEKLRPIIEQPGCRSILRIMTDMNFIHQHLTETETALVNRRRQRDNLDREIEGLERIVQIYKEK